MTSQISVAQLPSRLREYALTDVKHMTLPSDRSVVELAAADEIDRLRSRVSELEEDVPKPSEEVSGPIISGCTHDVKVWPEFWDMLASGDKPFELRYDDRGYRTGDILLLREWTQHGGYTGRQLRKQVTCVIAGLPWLHKDMVCMGLRDV